jgi:type I restriction enzyme S subunit
MSELPKGWCVTRLAEVSDVALGKMLDRAKRTKGKLLPYLRNANVRWGRFDLSNLLEMYFEEDELERYGLEPGDLLVCEGGEPGRAAVWAGVSQPIKYQKALLRVRMRAGLDPRWVMYSLRRDAISGNLEGYFTGSTIKHFPQQAAQNYSFPLPPLNEQRRIVAKLEKLLSCVDATQARLATIPRILKRFRQSVLAAACSGRLTVNWRGDVENKELDDLPSGWSRVELETLLPRNGIFDGPFGSNLKTSDYTSSGVRVIRLENIGHLKFIEEKETYISEKKYETLIKHTVQEGDIIFASFIADEIRACVLPPLKTKAIAKADCFCLRPKSNLVDRTYLTYQLVSQETFNALIDNIHGATRPRINTTQLRRLQVRICSLPEQQEIVRRVEALFKTADALEARYRTARAHVDKLRQSILARAFRGELVTTEAELTRQEGCDYEPASVLLGRIRQERAQQQQKSAKSNTRRKPRRKEDSATKKMFAK